MPIAVGRRSDYIWGVIAGLIIGALLLPILKSAQPGLYADFGVYVIPFFVIGIPAGLFAAALLSKALPFVWQLAKFLVIGVMNTLVDLGILALITIFVTQEASPLSPENTWFSALTLTITYYSLYKGLSFIIANVNSYLWNKYWTFEASGQEKVATEFLQFFLISIIGFTINVGVASLVFTTFEGTSGLSVAQWGLIGAAVGSITGFLWNFAGYKFIVFKK